MYWYRNTYPQCVFKTSWSNHDIVTYLHFHWVCQCNDWCGLSSSTIRWYLYRHTREELLHDWLLFNIIPDHHDKVPNVYKVMKQNSDSAGIRIRKLFLSKCWSKNDLDTSVSIHSMTITTLVFYKIIKVVIRKVGLQCHLIGNVEYICFETTIETHSFVHRKIPTINRFIVEATFYQFNE